MTSREPTITVAIDTSLAAPRNVDAEELQGLRRDGVI